MSSLKLDDILKSEVVLSRVPSTVKRASSERQLHKLAANQAGLVGKDLDIESALKYLGKKIYVKRAEWAVVANGINALAEAGE